MPPANSSSPGSRGKPSSAKSRRSFGDTLRQVTYGVPETLAHREAHQARHLGVIEAASDLAGYDGHARGRVTAERQAGAVGALADAKRELLPIGLHLGDPLREWR